MLTVMGGNSADMKLRQIFRFPLCYILVRVVHTGQSGYSGQSGQTGQELMDLQDLRCRSEWLDI